MVQRELGLDGFCGRGPDEGLQLYVAIVMVGVVDRAKAATALPVNLKEGFRHQQGAGTVVELESWCAVAYQQASA